MDVLSNTDMENLFLSIDLKYFITEISFYLKIFKI